MVRKKDSIQHQDASGTPRAGASAAKVSRNYLDTVDLLHRSSSGAQAMQDLAPKEPALSTRPSNLAPLAEVEPAGVPSSAASDATSVTPIGTPRPSPGFRFGTAHKRSMNADAGDGMDADSPIVEGPQNMSHRRQAAFSILQGIRRHYASIVDLVSYVGLGLVFYAALYLLLGKVMLPPREGWALFLLWTCAHIGGAISSYATLPPLLGMLVAGIILRNIPQDPVHNLPAAWQTKLRTGGLAVILMRAGLKIEKQAFKRAPGMLLRLASIPMLAEACVDAGTYYWLFNMPIALAFTAGFIQSAISPTVLVTGMLELQRQNYGSDKIIPSIEMAAAGLDSIGAIVGFAICSGIAIPSGNLVYSICSGPLQVVYGLVLACIGTLICSCTRFWNNRFKRAAAIFFTGLSIMYLGLHFNYLGASSVGCLSLAVLSSYAWERGWPRILSKGPRLYYPKTTDAQLAVVWIILVQPLLFGCIGIELDFRVITGSLVPKTVIILAIGVICTRLPTAFTVLTRSGLTLKEQAFVAFSWIPKATIQGALGATPLMLINSNLKQRSDFAKYQVWGEDILHATALSIIFTAPIGLLVVALLGPHWLRQGSPALDAHPAGPVLPQQSPSHRKRARRRHTHMAAAGAPPTVTLSNPLASLYRPSSNGSMPTAAMKPGGSSNDGLPIGGEPIAGMSTSDQSSGTATPIKSAFQQDGATAALDWSEHGADEHMSNQRAAALPTLVSQHSNREERLPAHAAGRAAESTTEVNRDGSESAGGEQATIQ
ncbi:hypothetical protein WJX74_009403 [Apatococcus lobatus]|uniref:Cation/H+ exchanger transmembrane domain-containing protein n=1 Tax=Apatococcus lobatus TaxID=904363 RepID=A0AAW1QZD8_9CHLO